MTIEWKIGKEYRTRLGEKVYLFGIKRSGTNHFEDKYGSRFTTDKQGYWLNSNCKHNNDIVSEWREPHVHESVVYICEHYADRTKTGDFIDHVTNLAVFKWNKFKQDDCNRKFKVRVEEVLE